jgi:YggT family protein
MNIFKIAVYQFVQVINFLILIRVLMSWVVRDYRNPIARFIYQVTEPILAPFRNLLQRFGVGGTLDFSPILAMLTVEVIANFINNLNF